MPEATARFGLPFILPGQAQKEVYHNEALALVDLALAPAVEGEPLDAPPGEPADGLCWLVGADPAGAWSGRAGQIAAWTASGWRFLRPQPGIIVWSKADGHWLHFDGAAWIGSFPAKEVRIAGAKVLGERQPEVPSPSGGTVIDEEARLAIAGIIATLKSHGLTE